MNIYTTATTCFGTCVYLIFIFFAPQGKSNTDPRMRELKTRPSSSEDRPKSHSPTYSKDNSDRKSITNSTDRNKKVDSTLSVDKNDDSCCNNSTKNTSWSSADSIQHFPERDTSGHVRTIILNFFITNRIDVRRPLFVKAPPLVS